LTGSSDVGHDQCCCPPFFPNFPRWPCFPFFSLAERDASARFLFGSGVLRGPQGTPFFDLSSLHRCRCLLIDLFVCLPIDLHPPFLCLDVFFLLSDFIRPTRSRPEHCPHSWHIFPRSCKLIFWASFFFFPLHRLARKFFMIENPCFLPPRLIFPGLSGRSRRTCGNFPHLTVFHSEAPPPSPSSSLSFLCPPLFPKALGLVGPAKSYSLVEVSAIL